MKSVNYDNLKLFLLANEKLNSYDYIELVKNFPFNNASEIFEEITKNQIQLFQPKYLIDENDILFKRNYADNGLLSKSNNFGVKETVIKLMKQIKLENKKKPKKKEEQNNNLDLESENDINSLTEENKQNEEGNNYKYLINLPNKIFPTNIPTIQNSSLSNYYDMFNDIDTSLLNNEEQIYLKTVFNDDIVRNRYLRIEAGVPCQRFVNHSDVAGGSTLGNILASSLPLRGIDMGNPLLAMHSCRETAAVQDHLYCIEAFRTFYEG